MANCINPWDKDGHYGQKSALYNNVFDKANENLESEPVAIPPHGKVTFIDFPPEKLKDFAVIPEEEKYYNGKVFTPENRKYKHIDGFFWKGKPSSWFKIPDDCHAYIENSKTTFTWTERIGKVAEFLGEKCRWCEDNHWALEQNPFKE